MSVHEFRREPEGHGSDLETPLHEEMMQKTSRVVKGYVPLNSIGLSASLVDGLQEEDELVEVDESRREPEDAKGQCRSQWLKAKQSWAPRISRKTQ